MTRATGVEAPPMQEALRVAFENHYLSLLRLCTLLTGRQDVAEDIVQEAFVRVEPKIESVATKDVGWYLRRTAVNLWKNNLRRLALERRPCASRDEHASGTPLEERDALWRE